jgi:hypothetical protein
MFASMAMIERIELAKRYLWAFIELGFLAVLAIILIYLLLGQSSGEYVVSVAMIGIGVILAIVYLITQRMR